MKTQQFKGQKLTTTKCVNNILKVYHRNESPTNWYEEAHDYAYILAHEFYVLLKGIHIAKTAGIIAALSPLKSWDLNMQLAKDFLKTGTCGHTKTMVNKAKAILESDGNIDTICDILNGNKITSFFLNIYNPDTSNVVTIDRHAMDIALGSVQNEDKRSMTVAQYEFFQNCYIVAANKLGVMPHYVQSVTWEQWRREKNNLKN